MGTERPLRHAAKPFMVHPCRNAADGPVGIEAHHRGLAVMISGYKQILALRLHGQLTSPHAPDIGRIQLSDASVLMDPVGHHALVRDGIQGLAVSRRNQIGGIVDLHLTALFKSPVFHIHIINRDSLCVACVGIGTYIGHIYTLHLTDPPKFLLFLPKDIISYISQKIYWQRYIFLYNGSCSLFIITKLWDYVWCQLVLVNFLFGLPKINAVETRVFPRFSGADRQSRLGKEQQWISV